MGCLFYLDDLVDTSIQYRHIAMLVSDAYKMSDEAQRELLAIHYNYIMGNINKDVINLNSSEHLVSYLREEKPSVLIRKRKVKR